MYWLIKWLGVGLSSSLDGCSGWELKQAYLTELTDFSDLIGDASLQLEVLFVAAVGDALRPLADATLFWHGKKTRDERRVNSESVALIKTMRAASSIFNTYTTALKEMAVLMCFSRPAAPAQSRRW